MLPSTKIFYWWNFFDLRYNLCIFFYNLSTIIISAFLFIVVLTWSDVSFKFVTFWLASFFPLSFILYLSALCQIFLLCSTITLCICSLRYVRRCRSSCLNFSFYHLQCLILYKPINLKSNSTANTVTNTILILQCTYWSFSDKICFSS